MWIYATYDNGTELWINPNNVTHVEPEGTGTIVYLTNGESLSVKADFKAFGTSIQKWLERTKKN